MPELVTNPAASPPPGHRAHMAPGVFPSRRGPFSRKPRPGPGSL